MRVKKLDIFGFKSFASRQSITFGDGVTGVVGPNGCGKSNVVDALRWVMGEQNARHLRGGNMQDIIFCGSEKKAALGFAEVTLTLENLSQDAPLDYNHYTEISITRRLYKTGESEYEINRQKARLKDISEFFMGTGVGTKAYSIIEQGRVNEVISAKPHDRRAIIEEAAGITKYKSKKAAAERRIEATRTNLDRIVDIRNEIEKRVNALWRDKEKLDQVNGLKTTIRRLDLHVSSHQYLAFLARLNFVNNYSASLNKKIDDLKRDIAVIEQSFDRVLKEYSEKHEQKRLLEDLGLQHKNSEDLLNKDLEYTKQTLADNQNFITRVELQLGDLAERKTELEQNIAQCNEQHRLASEQLLAINQHIAAKKDNGQQVILDRQNNLLKERDLQAKILSAATLAARMQAELNALVSQEALRKSELLSAENELADKKQEALELDNRLAAIAHELSLGQAREMQLKTKLNESDAAMKSIDNERINSEKLLNATLEAMRQATSRLSSLKEIDQKLEWSDSGIATLLSQDLLKGVVADAINVPAGFTDTVEKCLSHLLDTGLISKKEDLKRTSILLKNKKSATTSFFVLDDADMMPAGKLLGLKCMSDFFTINDSEYVNLATKLSRYFFADDFEQALDHWPAARLSQAFIVTTTGELLTPDGRAIIYGTANNKGVLQRKNEQSELEKKLVELEKTRGDQQDIIEVLKDKLDCLEDAKLLLLEDLKPLSLGLIRLEENLRQKKHESNRLEVDQQRLHDKLAMLLKNVQNNDQRKVELQAEWARALNEHKELEEVLDQVKNARLVSEQNYDHYQNELKALEIEKASCQEKTTSMKNASQQAEISKDHVQTQMDLFRGQADEKKDEELKLKEKERQILKKIEQLRKEITECERQLLSLRVLCAELSESKNTAEKSLGVLKGQIEQENRELLAQVLVINNIENDIKNLSERILERYNLILAHELTDFHHIPLDQQSSKKEMDELKRALEKIGSVNENAANEYSEFKARKDFLDAQITDLEDALNQLESAIKKINKTTRMRFIEAFNSINKQFSQVFPRLFNGGVAELILTDDEDLLTCGVDIMAKPPGKNVGSIELMSGGEKALTAISLIMAIFLIKPSPFCLLDEVDAPLDEANVSRFSQLIKEMSELSQFIVITHNRKTMESADQLYGVTMEDAGSSKIVSVHVQQAFESLKISSPAPKKAAPGKAKQLFLDDVLS
jgi:chromosome segregation protein